MHPRSRESSPAAGTHGPLLGWQVAPSAPCHSTLDSAFAGGGRLRPPGHEVCSLERASYRPCLDHPLPDQCSAFPACASMQRFSSVCIPAAASHRLRQGLMALSLVGRLRPALLAIRPWTPLLRMVVARDHLATSSRPALPAIRPWTAKTFQSPALHASLQNSSQCLHLPTQVHSSSSRATTFAQTDSYRCYRGGTYRSPH